MSPRLTAEQIRLALVSGVRVQPSRIDTFPGVWEGVPKPRSRWTVQQYAKLESELAAAKATEGRVAAAIVRKLWNLERVEGWTVDLGTHSVECPLLARTRNHARVLIISPGGEKLWINAR